MIFYLLRQRIFDTITSVGFMRKANIFFNKGDIGCYENKRDI